MGTMTATRSPNVTRVKNTSLAERMEFQQRSIRERHFFPLGRLLTVHLGVCDEAAYFQAESNRAIGARTRVTGLCLDWGQEHGPEIASAQFDRDCFLLPRGIEVPPRIADPLYRRTMVAGANTAPDFLLNGLLNPKYFKEPPKISQDLADFAAGKIFSRDGKRKFFVLQPVMTLVVLPYGVKALVLLHGRTGRDGTKPAMLIDPINRDGFFVGGLLTFDR